MAPTRVTANASQTRGDTSSQSLSAGADKKYKKTKKQGGSEAVYVRFSTAAGCATRYTVEIKKPDGVTINGAADNGGFHVPEGTQVFLCHFEKGCDREKTFYLVTHEKDQTVKVPCDPQ